MLRKIIWNKRTRELTLKALQLLPVRKRQVMAVCWNGNKYNCNPRAITDKLLEYQSSAKDNWTIYFAFEDYDYYKDIVNEGIIPVKIGSLEYYKYLATSQFVISNTRFGGSLMWPFPKRKGQYYIQTMHGGHGMKRQELEVKDSLPEDYIKLLYNDASRIDLMISDSTFWTKLARTIFAYPEGDILEVGLPRNDIFFNKEINSKMCSPNRDNKRYLIYCPTFRASGDTSVYGFDVDRLVAALEKRFGGEWYIRVHCHPNMLDIFHEVYDFSHPRMIDVAKEELQYLLVTSDAAITDYSSAGFEFALTNRPVFLLARDVKEYDRGMYFNPRELPFPFAENDDELCSNIIGFDNERYVRELLEFNKNIIGLHETGHAASSVVEWMYKRV